MLTGFGYIGLFLIVSVLFASSMVLIPLALRIIGVVPKKPDAVKNSTFECGMKTIGNSMVRFNFRYYFYALMFITLDVLAVFLYPWATDVRGAGEFGFIAVLIFIVITVVGYLYAWKKKVLEWK